MYTLKLHHFIDAKIDERSVGPCSLATQETLFKQ